MSIRNYGLVKDEDQLGAFVDRIEAAGKPFGFDIETGYDGPDRDKVSLHPDDPDSKVVGISFTNSLDWARYVPTGHDLARNFEPEPTALHFWRMLNLGGGVAHNAKFELRHLARWFRDILGDHDSLAGEQVRATRGYYPVLSDTMIEAYIAGEYASLGLKALTKQLFDHDQAELMSLFPGLAKGKMKSIRFNILELTPEVVAYACEDSVWCLGLHEKHYPVVKDKLLYKTEMALLPVLCDMEDYGVRYDWPSMRAAAERGKVFLEKQNSEVQADLSALAGETVNVNLGSPKQVGDMLYGKLGLPVSKKTNTGAASTDAIALEGLSRKYPVVRRILEWKEMRKLISTYLEKYQSDYDYAPDGMTHPNIMQTAVVTGRFAVSDPPYQQTPKMYHYELNSGETYDLNFRDLIICPPGHYMLGFDYSQIELRMMAGEAQEPTLLAAFENDDDVHTATASLMLSTPRDQVTKEQRAIGKTMNFALLYGMGPKSLAQRLALPKDEAQRLYDQYFSSYSSISTWVDRVTREGKARGFALTKFGRRCPIFELQSTDAWIYSKGERNCVNSPIQGAAADYMKLAMVRAYAALKKAELLDRVHLAMNIHDALEFYVHESVDPKEVIDVLAPAVVYRVSGLPKIVADWHIGMKWGSLTELHRKDDGTLIVKKTGEVLEDWRTAQGTDSGLRRPAPEDEGDDAGGSGDGIEEIAPEALRAAVALPPAKPVEGMPGSWSHCGSSSDHYPHRHQVTTNEGPHHNVLCLGTPGDPNGSVPLVEPKYAPDNRQAVEDHQLAAKALEPGKKLVITIKEMPDEHQYHRFVDMLFDTKGPHTVQLVTPEGELDYEGVHTGLTPDHQGQISMLLGGAEVKWAAESVDHESLTAGLVL